MCFITIAKNDADNFTLLTQVPIKSNDRALFSKGFRLVAYFLIHPFYPRHFTWIMQKEFLTFLTPQLTWDKKGTCISSQFQTPERNPSRFGGK